MFRFNKSPKASIFSEGDGDDDELFSGPSEKLSSLFQDELPSKNPKILKYVPPKQPSKDPASPTGSSIDNTPIEKQESIETKADVLFAAAVELFLYQGQETISHGLVMCCITYRKSTDSSVLLIYKSKGSFITKTEISAYFQLTVQKDNYVSFIDSSNKQWSLRLHECKYEEFLFQVGVCRANSTFRNSSSSITTQVLSYCKGDTPLKGGDCPRVTFSSWQVEKLKKDKLIDKSHEYITVHLTSEESSWKRGLIGCLPNQHAAIFVKVDSGSSFNIVAYEVTAEDLGTHEKMQKNEESIPPDMSSMKKENEKSKKAVLISRMAKVGQPLLPSTPSHIKNLSSFPTDSESEEDPSIHRRFRSKNGFPSSRSSPSSSIEEPRPTNNILTSRKVSTSSSVEEINTREQKIAQDHMTSSNDGSFHNVNQIPDYNTQRHSHNIVSGVPHGAYQPSLQGTVIAYQPQPIFQQPQQQIQSLPVNNSDSLLSLLFTESRSQNTDMRVALSQLTQKVDLVYNKINTMDQLAMPSVVTTSGLKTNTSEYDPQDLLKQITTLVEQLLSYKEKVALKDERIEQLSQDYTQVLKKNQTLLEEKAELLSLKSEAFECKMESEVKTREMKLNEEERLSLKKELEDLKKESEERKKFGDELESSITTLQQECKMEKVENAKLNDDLLKVKEDISKFSDENQNLKSEIVEMKKMSEEMNEKLVKSYTEKLKTLETENLKLKDEIKVKNESEIIVSEVLEVKEKLKLQEQTSDKLKEELEIIKKNYKETNKENEILKLQLENELKFNVKKDEELNSKNEHIFQLESKLKKLQEEKAYLEKMSGTNSDVASVGLSKDESDHKKIDAESLGKDIMNTAYRILKKGLSSSQMYNKQNVLDSVVDAFRETILKYSEEAAAEVQNTKETSQVKSINKEENSVTKKPMKEAPKVESIDQSPETSGHMEETSSTAAVIVGSIDINDNEVILPPSINISTELLENQEGFVEPSEEVMSERSIIRSLSEVSGEENAVSLDVEKSEPSFIEDETSKLDKKISSNTPTPSDTIPKSSTEKLSDEIKDDDLTWKTGPPPPPPPPLFSDSDDNDDWFS